MVGFLQLVNWRWNAFHARLDLERQKLRIMPRLVQVSTMKPKRILLRRLPHILLFTLPRAGVFWSVGPQSPAFPDFVRGVLIYQIGNLTVHSSIRALLKWKLLRTRMSLQGLNRPTG